MDNKIYYYKDELNDDFAGENINPTTIDENYKYIHKNVFWKLSSFIVYRLIAMPIAFIYSKIVYGLKFENKNVLKDCKDTGYFIFGNHTQKVLDPFIPTLGNFPRKCHIVAHPDNISIPFLGTFNKMMGGFPIPSDIKTTKNFFNAMEEFISKKNVISVYPEAHIWPYYTKIRPFKAVSFEYPVNLKKPVFCMTNTYQSYEKDNNKIKMVTYIDGPFFVNEELSKKEQKQDLRDRVYNCMVERSKNSNIELIKYCKN